MATLDIVTAAELPPEGEWIAPGGDMDDIEFLTVGFTDAYTDAQNLRHRRLARAYGGDVGAVPVALLRKANLECLLEKRCVTGIRNLLDVNKQPISWDEVKVMVFDPKYRPLADGLFAAARLATLRREADLGEAEGNSAKSSGTNSNGAPTGN
ncbi:hypothetical protein HMPREF9946_02162 [Acetobacteraceae bacterium AT-5844]|nr:hypothetical protein HMPREF9946_02162 [Acetobacteraceae bacterium AT-5844]